MVDAPQSLRCEAVEKRFGAVRAVDGVTLECRAGETTCLIGPSGCGKSTLLRVMNGLQPPDAGRVFWGEREVTPETARELRLRMGYVLQDGGLFPHLDARDNACLAARFLGWSEGRLGERLEKLGSLCRLEPSLWSRFPLKLSGGQRQRVALVRALMLDPELLLMDEPLGALDPLVRADLQMELAEIFQRLNKTVVLVTHDLPEAATLGQRLVLLRSGRIVQEGTLDALRERPEDPFVTRFLSAQRVPTSGGSEA